MRSSTKRSVFSLKGERFQISADESLNLLGLRSQPDLFSGSGFCTETQAKVSHPEQHGLRQTKPAEGEISRGHIQ